MKIKNEIIGLLAILLTVGIGCGMLLLVCHSLI